MTSEHSVRQDSEEESNNECCVCLENAPDCVIYTCGHMCMCYSCAIDIKNAKDEIIEKGDDNVASSSDSEDSESEEDLHLGN